MNENEDTTHKNLWGAAEAELGGKFIALNGNSKNSIGFKPMI